MATATAERRELANLCSAKNWSKAIRVLDKLLAQSPSIQDICNRAFCYSQLELHKHVIKDCNRALELDSTVLQAYILKGNALSALGRKDEAILVLEQGYQHALHQSTDLRQLLELEELVDGAKDKPVNSDEHAVDSSTAEITASEIDNTLDVTSNLDIGSKTNNKAADESNDVIGSDAHSKEDDKNGISNLPSDTNEACYLPDELAKLSKKFFVTRRNSKTKSISVDFRLSRGIAQVNEGNYDEAISIFNQVLRENPSYPEALIGRGTAYAFQRVLDAAVSDFTKAIQLNPEAGEAWKRRGQARAVMGEFEEAIEDLTKALEFEPDSPDILHERGIVNYKFKDYDAAVEDLTACVLQDKRNKSAYTYLGLALSSVGEYKQAEEAHLKAIKIDKTYLEGWTHLVQFYQDLASVEKAFTCLQQVLLIDERSPKAYHLRGLLHHGMGQHKTAINDLSVAISIESTNIECLYLRASCYHAIGEYINAVKDYDGILDIELDSMDKFVIQCLAFYQKEIALYTASKINSEFCSFDIDLDIDPLFKVYWCKRLHPKYVCERVFRQPSLKSSLKKGHLKKQEFGFSKHKASLLQAADFIGQKIQYSCPGFFPNRRQHRMAGLAAIEIAQKVSRAWRSLKYSNKNGKKARRKEKLGLQSQNRGGAGCSTSTNPESPGSSGLEDRSASGHFLSWQEVYSIAVKWRQISEPCDPVVWVNKLGEEFKSGFGSHTPMLLGQSKVVRYFPNYQRTLNMAKSLMWVRKCVNNAEDKVIDLSQPGKLQKIVHASSCSELYDIVGENFWVATTCDSVACEGERLEGTRITVQKMDKRGFDFAIRTPCTPPRWAVYDLEMAIAWETLCNAYTGEVYGSHDFNSLEDVRDTILRMTYYWYNFMPLSRGSAVVGYVVMLGLMLAANMEVTGVIPHGVQVDWEAILTPSPNAFVDTLKSWIDPTIKISTSWKDLPDVASTLSTTGSVIAALSNYDAEAVKPVPPTK